jgi:hypothetical protein
VQDQSFVLQSSPPTNHPKGGERGG